MEQIILNLIKLQNQLRINHWQTESYAQHVAFGEAYNALDALLDQLVETHQGKHGKISFDSESSVELTNLEELSMQDILTQVTDYLSTEFDSVIEPERDTDCLNIRDEILQSLNKLKYLLTLK
jgi:DNA-binding ferritin-like protein